MNSSSGAGRVVHKSKCDTNAKYCNRSFGFYSFGFRGTFFSSFHFPPNVADTRSGAQAHRRMLNCKTILPGQLFSFGVGLWNVQWRPPWRIVMQVVYLDPERMA
jgi:hypothetical protein